LEYSSPLWSPIAKGDIQRLEDIQHSFIRKIKGVDRNYTTAFSSISTPSRKEETAMPFSTSGRCWRKKQQFYHTSKYKRTQLIEEEERFYLSTWQKLQLIFKKQGNKPSAAGELGCSTISRGTFAT
jgi:hypothetical protein